MKINIVNQVNAISALAAIFSIFLFGTVSTIAQTTTEDSDQVKNLKEQNAVLEQQLKRAENEKKLADIYTLKSDVKGLDGSIKNEGDAYIETEALAYSMMNVVGQQFSRRICLKMSNYKSTDDKGKPANSYTGTIFIFNHDQLNDLLNYLAVQNQLKLFDNEYDNAIATTKPAPASSPGPNPSPNPNPNPGGQDVYGFNPILAVPIAEGLIKSGIEIASLFKVDTQITGKTFQIQEGALASAVTENLVANNLVVKYPSLYLPNMSNSTSAFLSSINALQKKREIILEFLKPLNKEKAELDERLLELVGLLNRETDAAKLNLLKAEKTAKEGRSKILAGKIAPYTALNQAFTDYVLSFQTVKDNAGTTAMIRILSAEKLKQAVDDGDNRILFLSVMRSGGNVKITKQLFRSDKMYQSGGFIGMFFLLDKEAKVIDTTVKAKYDGYFKVKNKAVEGATLIP